MELTGKTSAAGYLSKILTIVIALMVIFLLAGIGLEIYSIITGDTATLFERVSFNFNGLRFNVLNSPEGNVNISAQFKILAASYLLLIIYLTANLRQIFRNLREGMLFYHPNAGHMRRIGVTVIIIGVVSSLLEMSSAWMLYDYLLAQGVDVDVMFELDVVTLFIGVVILLFASIFQKAADIAEEQNLTI
ncbi:MAG: DUF2975 domain-containing protein [Bacillota bacterium]